MTDSNRRPSRCDRAALPAALIAHVGLSIVLQRDKEEEIGR